MRTNLLEIIKSKRDLKFYSEYLRIILDNHDITHSKSVITAIKLELNKLRRFVKERDKKLSDNIVKSICEWAAISGIAENRTSNQILKIGEEITELAFELEKYTYESNKSGILDNIKLEIGDVYISLVTTLYCQYGNTLAVEDVFKKIKPVKKSAMFYADSYFRLLEYHRDFYKVYKSKYELDVLFIEHIVQELHAICYQFGLDLNKCVVDALRKNIERSRKNNVEVRR